MKYLAITLAGILTSVGIAYVFNREEPLAVGAPATEITFQKNLIPLSDSRYTIGTTTKAWLNGFFDELCLAGDCKTAWPTGGAGGGGGMTVYFQNGGATLNTATTTVNFTPNSFSVVENPTDTLTIRIATTTLGLLTTNVSEGSNLYYTDTRARAAITENITGMTFNTGVLSVDSGYAIPTTTRLANHDTAFGWGNHASQGYITDGNTNWDNSYGYVTQGQTVGTTTAGVLGQAAYWTGARTLGTVATGTLTESVLGLELDNSTRGLFGGSAALSLTSGYLIPTTTRAATWDLANSWGNHAVAGYITDGNTGWDNLYGLITATNATASITTATTTNLAIPTSLSLFGGEKVTTANALCIQLTGSADLCDGGDASGGGGGVSDWIKNAALDAIRPTTTVGIVVSASSSISELNTASLRVNSDTVTDLTGFGMAVGSGALGLLQTGAADGECLKYVAAGPTIDWASCGGAATAGGNDEEIQFNDGTSLGGASLFTFDNETGRLGLGTTSPAAVFAIASSTYNYSIPLFMIATSSDPSGSLFSVFATTTAAANATGTTNISNGARVLIGTLPSYLRSANISSEFYVNGNVDTSYWNYQCNARNAITAPGADAQFACGDAAYQEDTTGAGTTLSNLSVRISERAFGITDATANGGAGFFFDAVSARTVLASTTPTFEATINVFTGTTTARVGFFNIDPAGTAFEVGPTVGVYFTASSSLSNWQFVVKGIGVESVFDSGVPSTTDAFIRIKTDSQNAYGWIGTPSSRMNLVGTAAINVGSINTTQMTSGAYQARTLGGSASAGLQLQSMELWMRKLYAQFNY